VAYDPEKLAQGAMSFQKMMSDVARRFPECAYRTQTAAHAFARMSDRSRRYSDFPAQIGQGLESHPQRTFGCGGCAEINPSARKSSAPAPFRVNVATLDSLSIGVEMATAMRRPSTVDDYVGMRIRERRIMLGLTQHELAELIGVTYQQVHKYECGINRMTAGRLYEIARELNAPIEYFYEGFGKVKPPQPFSHQRMLHDVLRHFGEIQNERHQDALSQLTRTLAAP
jgi:transcriptional regulator with XRE-family HTH domain